MPVEMTAEQHATENDAIRAMLPACVSGNRLVITRGVAALDDRAMLRALMRVKTFDTFTEDNDPHLEHDFGAFELEGHKFFWKIDFYNGEEGIHKLLTLLLASEY